MATKELAAARITLYGLPAGEAAAGTVIGLVGVVTNNPKAIALGGAMLIQSGITGVIVESARRHEPRQKPHEVYREDSPTKP